MKLSELKKMVAEEYSRYLAEQDQPPMPPMPPAGGDPSISVEPDDIQVGEDPEQMLRNIYDMLKTHFEAGDMGMGAGAPPMPPADMGQDMDMVDMGDEDEMGDVELDDEEEEAPVAENSSKEASVQKTGYKPFAKKTHGKDAPYGKAGKKSTKNAGYDAGSKSLNEVKRMQRLANIIK
jgi:hypothetical protein